MPTPSSSSRDLRDPRTDGGHNGGLIFRLGIVYILYEYDKGLGCYLGYVSPEIARDEAKAKQEADYVMTLVARGLTSH